MAGTCAPTTRSTPTGAPRLPAGGGLRRRDVLRRDPLLDDAPGRRRRPRQTARSPPAGRRERRAPDRGRGHLRPRRLLRHARREQPATGGRSAATAASSSRPRSARSSPTGKIMNVVAGSRRREVLAEGHLAADLRPLVGRDAQPAAATRARWRSPAAQAGPVSLAARTAAGSSCGAARRLDERRRERRAAVKSVTVAAARPTA